jgi:hypothetical protein
MVNEHIKLIPTSLAIRNTSQKAQCNTTRTAAVKSMETTGADMNVEELEASCVCDGKVKWCTHCREKLGIPQNAKRKSSSVTHQFPS